MKSFRVNKGVTGVCGGPLEFSISKPADLEFPFSAYNSRFLKEVTNLDFMVPDIWVYFFEVVVQY